MLLKKKIKIEISHVWENRGCVQFQGPQAYGETVWRRDNLLFASPACPALASASLAALSCCSHYCWFPCIATLSAPSPAHYESRDGFGPRRGTHPLDPSLRLKETSKWVSLVREL